MRSDLPIGKQQPVFNARASRSQGPKQESLGGIAPVYKGLLPPNLSPEEKIRKQSLELLDTILFRLEEMNVSGQHEITSGLARMFNQVGIHAPERYATNGPEARKGKWYPQNRTVRLIEVVWKLQEKFLLQTKTKFTRAKRSDEFRTKQSRRMRAEHAKRKREGFYTPERQAAINEKIREGIRRKALAKVQRVEEAEKQLNEELDYFRREQAEKTKQAEKKRAEETKRDQLPSLFANLPKSVATNIDSAIPFGTSVEERDATCE